MSQSVSSMGSDTEKVHVLMYILKQYVTLCKYNGLRY